MPKEHRQRRGMMRGREVRLTQFNILLNAQKPVFVLVNVMHKNVEGVVVDNFADFGYRRSDSESWGRPYRMVHRAVGANLQVWKSS